MSFEAVWILYVPKAHIAVVPSLARDTCLPDYTRFPVITLPRFMVITSQASDVDIRRVCEHSRDVARISHARGAASFATARLNYLARLARECFRAALGEPRVGYDVIQASLGVTIPLFERVTLADDDSALPEVSVWDPILVGWAFQVWKESEREGSSWGISYAGEENAERADISALTQIFTDSYIADFLVRSAVSPVRTPQERPLRVCDPGCGAGHLLIQALRVVSQRGETHQLELYGFDIDPAAVELTRVLLLAEYLRQGHTDKLDVVWRGLCERIQSLAAPLGILDRDLRLPSASFDVIVANPPYLGRRKMPAILREYLDAQYPVTKVDLCAAFLQRCVEVLEKDGMLAFIAADKWLRLQGYYGFRGGQGEYRGFLREVTLSEIVELGHRAFSTQSRMHDGVKVALVCGQKHVPSPSHELLHSDLSELASYDDKVAALSVQSARDVRKRRLVQMTLLDSGRESPFVRVSDLPHTLRNFKRTVADVAQVIVGLQTNDDRRYIRYVWEVPPDRSRWRVHSKGGGYSRWYGLNHWILDWTEGQHHFFKTDASRERAEQWASKPGWCYGWFANGCLGLRAKEPGWTFGRAATSGIFCEEPWLVAFLNSRWASLCVRHIGGKMQIPEGVVRRIPTPDVCEVINPHLVKLAVELKQRLVTLDPADVSFQPSLGGSWFDEWVLQALLLLVEGALEFQIEQTLDVSGRESIRLAERYGVPVAWLSCPSKEVEDEFWSVVPSEFLVLRDMTRIERVYTPGNGAVRPEVSKSHIREVLRRNKVRIDDPWPLPITSPVERLSRSWRCNPIETMNHVMSSARINKDVRDSLSEVIRYRKVLSLLLERLDHRWWSHLSQSTRVAGVSLALDEAARLVHEELSSLELWERDESSVKEWLRGAFSAWHTGHFHRRSPLCESSRGSRGVVYSHRWDVSG